MSTISPVNKIRVKGVYYDLVRQVESIDSSLISYMSDDSSLMKVYVDANDDNVYVASHSDAIKMRGENKTLTQKMQDVADIANTISDSDLDIEDENGNVVLRLKGGHIKTKNFDSSSTNMNGTDDVILDNSEICDYFAVNSSGIAESSSTFGITRYIDCHGCNELKITMPQTTSASGFGLCFYDENKVLIPSSFVENPIGSTAGYSTETISIPTNAYYFRTTYWNYANSIIYGKFRCELNYPKGVLGYGKYRPYQSGNIFFSVEVDQSVDNWQSDDTSRNKIPDIKKTTGVLLLPQTYKNEGKKTPIIMYCHGKSHGVYYGTWGSSNTFTTQKQHFLNRGYAVFDCNGAKDTNKQADGANAFISSPQNVSAYYKTYKYIVENYNVDERIYVIGGSLGCPVATQFCLSLGNIVRAFAILAGYVQIKTIWGGAAGSTFRPYFGVAAGGDESWESNIEKIKGYAPELRMFTIDNVTYFNGMECPVHAWIGKDDASVTQQGTLTMHEQLEGFIEALRNSGKPAFIREPENTGHEIVSGAIQYIDDEVCDFFDNYK